MKRKNKKHDGKPKHKIYQFLKRKELYFHFPRLFLEGSKESSSSESEIASSFRQNS